MKPQVERQFRLFVFIGVFLFAGATPALSVDTFTLSHYSGPCGARPFSTPHQPWQGRSRISIASGERITVTLYSHGADFAEDATGPRIHEWISDRGTTTNYPNALGIPKGFVVVSIRAPRWIGLGNRTVTVHWPTGTERLDLRIVGNCADLATAAYRTTSSGNTGSFRPPPPPPPRERLPNLLPVRLFATTPLLRSVPPNEVVSTDSGNMTNINGAFCSGFAPNETRTVTMLDLVWGVSATDSDLANVAFEVELLEVRLDGTTMRVLDTLSLPQGFAPNEPLVTKANYPGRPASITVVFNPTVLINRKSANLTGCFTVPGSSPTLDPQIMVVRVDARGQINEGSRENDNDLRF